MRSAVNGSPIMPFIFNEPSFMGLVEPLNIDEFARHVSAPLSIIADIGFDISAISTCKNCNGE